jgi:hypothetical protein
MISSTFGCTFLVRIFLLLANKVRAGYRMAFFDLVIGGMANKLPLGMCVVGRSCGGEQLQVRPFFLFKSFAYMHSAY